MFFFFNFYMLDRIVIGTRDSQLARIQTDFIKAQLESLYPGCEFHIKAMTTTGDQVLDTPLKDIGTKALFTKELEQELDAKNVDLIVHSLKDVPTTLPPGMVISTITKRENPLDVVIMAPKNTGKRLIDLPKGAVIGTSSVRRKAQLSKHFDFVYKDIRGNLNTRFRKLEDESLGYDAMILAYAGVQRMGWIEKISEVLDEDVMMHAVGQGALGLEILECNVQVAKMLQPLQDHDCMLMCSAERAFMRRLEGGCSIPLGVASSFLSGELKLSGSVTSLDGGEQLKASFKTEIDVNSELQDQLVLAEGLGVKVAELLLDQGAERILKDIKR
jgi:hydroxymethylbilane synthase